MSLNSLDELLEYQDYLIERCLELSRDLVEKHEQLQQSHHRINEWLEVHQTILGKEGNTDDVSRGSGTDQSVSPCEVREVSESD